VRSSAAGGWDSQPVPNRVALWIAAYVAPAYRLGTPGWINRGIKTSDNAEMMRKRLQDPRMLLATRIDSFYGVVRLMQHARDRIGRVKGPVLFLYGAHDQLIPRQAAFAAAARLKPGDRSAYYPEGWHLLTRDLQAKVVWDDIEAFVRDPNAPLPSGAPPVPGAQRPQAMAKAP
jgi:acylglycerol lipase